MLPLTTLVARPKSSARSIPLFFIAALFLSNSAHGQPAVPGIPIRPAHHFHVAQGENYRIHGRVTALDPVARIFTISNAKASQKIACASTSVLIKDGRTVSFGKIQLNDEVDGLAVTYENKMTAGSVRFGPFKKDLPYGKPVPGKPGYIRSPYPPGNGYIDVRGIPGNMEIEDPYSGKVLLVPQS